MRNIFRRKSHGDPAHQNEVLRSISMPSQDETEIIHRMNRPPLSTQSEDISPTQSVDDTASVALSDTETLSYSKQQRMELQNTFDENYTTYLPYILRRLRHEHERAHAHDNDDDESSYSSDVDSEKTIALDLSGQRHIMQRSTATYNRKREMVVASEFIRSNTYVFPDRESFNMFRWLRTHNKRLRKNSMFVYDNNGDIKRVRGSIALVAEPNAVVDTRTHIVPLDYKLGGCGLPLFKILVPYMSSFRKKVPYMVFRRYHESPSRPSGDPDDDGFETYDYCTVHTKMFDQYKRYVLHFTPEGRTPFRVVMFLNNFRPFSDFVYKDTRFRVVGLALVTAYLGNYNPELKLIVIDDAQHALCDNLVNRRRRHSTAPTAQPDESTDLVDPVPDNDNPVLREDENGFMRTVKRDYIPNNMPPFGRFIDLCVYPVELLILPRKYSEVGKIELYQAVDAATYPDMSSTLSVDDDVLVLTTVLLVLRETSIRTTSRYLNGSLVSRVGTIGASALIQPTGLGYNFTSTM